jgi:DNA polymerase zeta
MSAPNVGERVPYVIVYGEPGRPLIHSVRSPKEVLASKWSAGNQVASLRPNATYYITKVIIPALSRCLSLVGADVMSW